jgi:cation transport regulator
MPYTNIADLPAAVRSHLPVHAQEIYLKAFNNAWREYTDRQDREAAAHKVAWAAVKRVYRKQGDAWVRK